jgi:F0F1-type ATP synthase assembly protein I
MPENQPQHTGDPFSLGIQMAVGVGLGCVVGWWLDRTFNWSPWGIIVGAMLGLAGGMYLLIKEAIGLNGRK